MAIGYGSACPKPSQTRLAEKTAANKTDAQQLEAFKRAVFARDGYCCRCCRHVVYRSWARDPHRAEAHHIHGRSRALRYEVRAGLTLCAKCHQRVSGAVNDKLRVVGTKHFTLNGRQYIDATALVTFREAR